MKRSLLLFIILICCASCNNGARKVAPQPFPIAEVPAFITTPEDIVDYMVVHYWDSFFSESRKFPAKKRDTTLIAGLTATTLDQAFADYTIFLRVVQNDVLLNAQQRLTSLCEAEAAREKSQQVWKNIGKLSDKYLYNPNSQYRNEEAYLVWTEWVANNSLSDENEKRVAKELIPQLSKNRIGQPASNFEFALKNGKKMQLSDVEAQYTILLFSNPGCADCRNTIETLSSIVAIEGLIAEKSIAIVNIYPDEDLEAWHKGTDEYPANWINGYVTDDAFNDKYFVRAIPSLYLLDKAHNVIYKDAPLDLITAHVETL
ncbi:MAG: DUF5106 domain-containing protein [Bacteroidales bacterium]|nr:DUF5106 domain-containing protein [Bacteroidales bacterium]